MSKPNERRGPRVMHGASRMLAQARDLSSLAADAGIAPASHPGASTGVAASPVGPVVHEAITRAEAAVLVRRLRVAELRVKYVDACLDNFAKQGEALPANHPFKGVVSQMISTMRELMQAADRQVPR